MFNQYLKVQSIFERFVNLQEKLYSNSSVILQLGVVAGSEVALSQMSLKEGGEGGLIVNTASLAGVSLGT